MKMSIFRNCLKHCANTSVNNHNKLSYCRLKYLRLCSTTADTVTDSVTEHERESPNNQDKVSKNLDPASSVLLFPNGGGQFVGMGKNTLDYPGVSELYESASDILDYDLLKLCLNGPDEYLNMPKYSQIAVMVTSLAAIQMMKETEPQTLENVVGVAGYGLGEITAYVYSDILNFHSAVRLVQIRAEMVDELSSDIDGGLVTVKCDHQTKLFTSMMLARQHCTEEHNIEEPVCCVAYHLSPQYKVIGGHKQAIDYLEKIGVEWGIKSTSRLPATLPYHTPLMRELFVNKVCDNSYFKFVRYLQKLKFEEPMVPVHSSILGNVLESKKPVYFPLKRQLWETVKWDQALHSLYSDMQGTNLPNTVVIGPGTEIGSFLKLMKHEAYTNFRYVDV